MRIYPKPEGETLMERAFRVLDNLRAKPVKLKPRPRIVKIRKSVKISA